MEAEGWYQDPYKLHRRRWFSEGRPTSLVRDWGVESRDQPPDRPYPTPLVEPQPLIESPEDASDLRRVDDGDPDGPLSFGEAASLAFDSRPR